MKPPFAAIAKALLSDPIGTLKAVMPKCRFCGASTIAACSKCGSSCCQNHGYICLGERDALCVPCVESMRSQAISLEQED